MTSDEAKILSKLPEMTYLRWKETIMSMESLVKGGVDNVITLLVPTVYWTLQIILVDDTMFTSLAYKMSKEKGTNNHCVAECGGVKMLFCYDNKQEAVSRGVCLSAWALGDPQVSATRVNYSFTNHLCGTYGSGYGSRPRSSCLDSVNSYRDKRYSRRAHPSPFVLEDDIPDHQYYSAGKQKSCLLQMKIEIVLRSLTNDIALVAERLNPSYTGLVDRLATKTIATTGRSLFSFCNGLHVDSCDRMNAFFKSKLFPEPRDDQQETLFSFRDLSFPTTCGYQHVWREERLRDEYDVEQYFVMPGLAMAFPLEDGTCHNFMGSAFSHCTSVCLLSNKSRDVISSNNASDIFRMFAWGNAANNRTASGNLGRHKSNIAEYRRRQKLNRSEAMQNSTPAPSLGRLGVTRSEVCQNSTQAPSLDKLGV